MNEPKYSCPRGCGYEWDDDADMHFLSCPNLPAVTKSLLGDILAGGYIGTLPSWEEMARKGKPE
jgi:hypothetical protein